MIKFQWKKLPVDSNGKSYDSLQAFQAAEIAKLLPTESAGAVEQICADIVNVKDEIIEILELTMDARPAARGVKKPRKAKATVAPIEELIPAEE